MNRNEATEIRHFLAFDDGVVLQVTSCDDAKAAAVENGHTAGHEGVRWWIEVHHYENGEPIAGGEWPCDCPNVYEMRCCDMGCGYRLTEDYAPWETTCGACLNMQAMAIERTTQ